MPLLNYCIGQMCDRKVEEIEIIVDDMVLPQTILLPSCILETPSLVRIELPPNLLFKLPESGIICLPNLTKLHVSLYFARSINGQSL